VEVNDLIVATSGPVRTMADSTLRLQLSIDAAMSKAAFKLFGARGTWMALTVLGKPDVPAVEGASAAVETMAKGHMRLFVDVDPRDAARAFDAFGTPDTLMALAALKPEHLRQRKREKQQRLEARGMRPAYLAVQWCKDDQFQAWLREAYPTIWENAQLALACKPAAEWARGVLLTICDLQSRSQLDTDPDARSRFDRNVRRPFMAWQQAQTSTQGA
jgi:hypothetical protein